MAWTPIESKYTPGVDFDVFHRAGPAYSNSRVTATESTDPYWELLFYAGAELRLRVVIESYSAHTGGEGAPGHLYSAASFEIFAGNAFTRVWNEAPPTTNPHGYPNGYLGDPPVVTAFAPAELDWVREEGPVYLGADFTSDGFPMYETYSMRLEVWDDDAPPPEPEPECFWTDLVDVSQVCGAPAPDPDPEPEPELPVVFAYNQHQGTPEGQTSRILLPSGVAQFTPVWVNGLYEFQDAEGGGGMLQTVNYEDAYGLVGPATLSNEQSPGEDWYEEVDVIIEYRSGVGYAQAGGWHGDGFMVVDSATTGAPEYDTLYPIDVNSDLGPVQLQIDDRVWTFEWESGRYVMQDPPPADDISGWGTITQNGVAAPMLITFFALWE